MVVYIYIYIIYGVLISCHLLSGIFGVVSLALELRLGNSDLVTPAQELELGKRSLGT